MEKLAGGVGHAMVEHEGGPVSRTGHKILIGAKSVQYPGSLFVLNRKLVCNRFQCGAVPSFQAPCIQG